MTVFDKLTAFHQLMLEQTRSKTYKHVREAMYATLPTFIGLLQTTMSDPNATSAERRWAADRYATQLERMHLDQRRDRDREVHKAKVKIAAKRVAVAERQQDVVVAEERARLQKLLES